MISHSSPIPLYIQLKEYFQKKIYAGEYPADTQLPSEREIANTFNVSRMTVRQALQMLSQEGLTYSRIGKGTFVKLPKIDQSLHSLTSFTEDMQKLGQVVSNKILSATVIRADAEVKKALQVGGHQDVVCLHRVRLAGGIPMAIEMSHIPHSLCPNILEKHDFKIESLYKVLQETYGLSFAWAEQKIDARLPMHQECALLDIGQHQPVLSIVRVTYDQYNHPVEFVRSVYRGDQFNLHVILKAETQLKDISLVRMNH